MSLHSHLTPVGYDYEIMVTDVTNDQYVYHLNEALTAGEVKIDREQVVGYYPGYEFHGYEHEEEIKAGDWFPIPWATQGCVWSLVERVFPPRMVTLIIP